MDSKIRLKLGIMSMKEIYQTPLIRVFVRIGIFGRGI
jgi:hypothetical protein